RGESGAFKRPRDGGGFMSRADFKRSASSPSIPPRPTPGSPAKSLIPRSFQAEAWKRDGHSGVFADSVVAQERPKRGRAAQDKSMKRTGPGKSTISDWRSPATKPTRYSRPSTAGLMEIARLAGRPARGRTARIWPRIEGHGARIIR